MLKGVPRPEYDRLERQWYLWDGQEAVLLPDGSVRLFPHVRDAYDWLATEWRRDHPIGVKPPPPPADNE